MNSSTTSSYRIKGPWLLLARAVWIILALVTISVFIAALGGLYTGWQKPCNTFPQEYQTGCIAYEQALHQFGLSRNFNAIYYPIGVIVEVLPWILAGVLIFWKKSEEPFGFLFSLMLVVASTFNLDEGIVENALFLYPIPQPILQVMGFIGGALLVLWYRFPNGHFVPRWLRWAAILWVPLEVGTFFLPNSPFDFSSWSYPWSDVVLILFATSIIYSLAYRYRRTSDLVQIQQIKWVALSASTVATMYVIPRLIIDPLIDLGVMPWNDNIAVIWNLTYYPLWCLSVMFVGTSLGFSILRYRLWDIDFIINRSLVYGSLTILLVAIFGGSLAIIHNLFQNFAQGPLVAVAISAAIFGALFQPIRRSVQRFVDQRFYNIHIDYQKTVPPVPSIINMQDLRGTVFGAYQNLELIGRGGMAEVYKSIHPTLKKTVAIKILPVQLAEEAEFRQRFTREAQVVSKLDHPNIVRVFDSGEQNGKHFMVMEYLNGKDLSVFLRAHGRLSLQQTLALVQQIAAALDYAHSQGLIHRDIKPSNVLLDTSNIDLRAILTDFGIAKILNSQTAMTRTGNVMGTFDYIAPEQIQESAILDGRADIYALGVMAYQMLTGELPFKHNNPGALLIAHLTQPPPDSCNLVPDLSKSVCNAVRQAMAKKPDERFATASEFAAALS
jgi:tRNA A-37 threonylcarbamoyl transferase component Bud32